MRWGRTEQPVGVNLPDWSTLVDLRTGRLLRTDEPLIDVGGVDPESDAEVSAASDAYLQVPEGDPRPGGIKLSEAVRVEVVDGPEAEPVKGLSPADFLSGGRHRRRRPS